jgi:hypothetical protein
MGGEKKPVEREGKGELWWSIEERGIYVRRVREMFP